MTITADNGDKIKAYQTTGEMQLLETKTDSKGKPTEALVSAEESKKAIESGATSGQLPLSNATNCHGTTFASGQVWIENDQADALRKGDGYRTLGTSERAQAGDIGVYTEGGGVVHSVHVDSSNATGVVDVVSKGGITSQRITSPGPGRGTAWDNPSAKLQYFTQRSKPKN